MVITHTTNRTLHASRSILSAKENGFVAAFEKVAAMMEENPFDIRDMLRQMKLIIAHLFSSNITLVINDRNIFFNTHTMNRVLKHGATLTDRRWGK